MKRALLSCAALSLLAGCAVTEPNAGRYPPPAPSAADAGIGEASRAAVAAAIADTARPQADRDRDAARRAAETLAFTRVGPGQRVVDLIPGSGYFTRLFARAVGPEGRVTAFLGSEAPAQYVTAIRAVSDDEAAYPNVDLLQQPSPQLRPGAPVDLVFTAQNYHDLHAFGADVAAINREIFAALRPGGLYVIIDHSAAEGTGATQANTLHRIDQAQVRREVEAAGFIYDGESPVLRNPADARTANVFDAAIRGRTDQFMMRFRRPLP